MKYRIILVLFIICCSVAKKIVAQTTVYNWGGQSLGTDAAQSKRIIIGRIYYNATHWGGYGNIKFSLQASYYKSGNVDYLLMANPAVGGNQPILYCLSSGGYLAGSVRIELGAQENSGTSYMGSANYYRDIYLDAAYYSTWFIQASVTGHYTLNKTTIASDEYYYMTLFSSPSSQEIADFSPHIKNVTIPTYSSVFSFNSKVGIGTSSPIHELHVEGSDPGLFVKGQLRSRLNLLTTDQQGWQIEVGNTNEVGNQHGGDLGFTESGIAGGRFVLKKGGM